MEEKQVSKKNRHKILTYLNSLTDKYSNITCYLNISRLEYCDFVIHIWLKDNIVDTFMSSMIYENKFDERFESVKSKCDDFIDKNNKYLQTKNNLTNVR